MRVSLPLVAVVASITLGLTACGSSKASGDDVAAADDVVAGATTDGLVPGDAAPDAATGTVHVKVTGGADAGEYAGNGNLLCTKGGSSPENITTMYTAASETAGELSMFYVSYTPEHEADPTVGTETLTVNFGIGPASSEHTYMILVNTSEGQGQGEGSATFSGNTLTVTGTAPGDVQFEATATCSSVG